MHALTLFAVAVPALAATTPFSSLISPNVLSKMTVSEANEVCGNGQTISCCNSIKQGDDVSEADGVLSGVGNGLLGGGLSLLDECSKLNVAALIGVQDLLNDQCTSNIACCQDSESEANTGLVNAALPCVALGSLVG